jgi:hypothetical protein
MIVSKIFWGDTACYNVHVEQIITSTYLDDKGRGIEDSILTIDTLKRILEDCSSSFCSILNFDNIISCQSNLINVLKEIKDASKGLIIINISNEIVNGQHLNRYKNANNLQEDDIYKLLYMDTHNSSIDYDFFNEELFKLDFKEKLKKYIHTKNKITHTSSSVYLNSYVDVKEFISLDYAFTIFSVYNLALKLKEKWLSKSDDDFPILVCQNSNSAFIASLLSGLLSLDILILDKIGPINKLYKRLGSTIIENKKYLVVSDFVCLGTEVKIVKNLIEFSGGKYLGNVSLIRVETIDAIDKVYKDALSVFEITRANNKDLNYYISTNLENSKNE